MRSVNQASESSVSRTVKVQDESRSTEALNDSFIAQEGGFILQGKVNQ